MEHFSANQTSDVAATLTFYMVLAFFPGLLALVSILKLSGVGTSLMPSLVEFLGRAVPNAEGSSALIELVEDFFSSSGAGIGLAIGLLTACWAASGYIAAFTRAMNRIYQVREGRNPIILKIQQYSLTIVIVASMAIQVAGLFLTDSVIYWLPRMIGLDSAVIDLWNSIKWPVMIVVTMIVIALLYNFSPNVRWGRVRPLTYGSILAVLTAVVAVAGFRFYVSSFAHYNATYGAIGSIIVGLWLAWLANFAIVLGAHLDLEVIRTRQLLAGEPSERQVQLQPRKTAGITRQMIKANRLAARGYELRLRALQKLPDDS